jgi:hypothetical protein
MTDTTLNATHTERAPKTLTVLDVIKIVLPEGTDGSGEWGEVCQWPPDLFAAVASITERSGLYSQQTFTAYWAGGFECTPSWIEDVRKLGREWKQSGATPSRVEGMWHDLTNKHANAPIDDPRPPALEWKKIAFALLVIADEACSGFGFLPETEDAQSPIVYAVYEDYRVWSDRSSANPKHVGGDLLPHLPLSLCLHVPRGLLCVQPKAMTPTTGCTLRSLTHNLALLPSVGNVRTSWIPASTMSNHSEPFNMLVVPFPYSIPGKSFQAEPKAPEGRTNYRVFTLDPDKWMNRDPVRWKGKVEAQDFAKFLCELMDEAGSELEPVHAVVMPETAIKIELADDVAKILMTRPHLELFLTGVVSHEGGSIRNLAAIYQFEDKKIIHQSYQSKHHRWCLDGDQIRRYHLGHVLDPESKWWEQINVGDRACYISSFRSYATLSVLVCEDLARYDPVLTVMNAIGPNLVVALLMDGPQLDFRWPGRYATSLADDPGSAVLTVTSLGMVSRSRKPGDPENREIALWKEPNGKAEPQKLPKGSHGLLLTLTSRLVEQYSLDGRSDGKMTMQFALGAAHGIAHPDPPSWIGKVP